MERIITDASSSIEIETPRIITDVTHVIQNLEPNFDSYIYGCENNGMQFGFIAGGVIGNKESKRVYMRALVAWLNPHICLTREQILIEWSTDPYEPIISVVDIRRDPKFFELDPVPDPRINPWNLFCLGSFVTDMDEFCYQRIANYLMLPDDASRLLDTWFGTQGFDVERTNYCIPTQCRTIVDSQTSIV
jgi:hypothetical protein